MATATIVKRLVKSNFMKIESDARVAFGDGVLFELIQYCNPTEEAVIIIRAGKFSGAYTITKTRAARWLGDNGYIFTRKHDGLTLNATSKPADQDRAEALAAVVTVSKAQQKMIDRLASGKYQIGCGRLWYTLVGDTWRAFGGKANDNTIDALIRAGVLVESGDPRKADYAVTLAAPPAADQSMYVYVCKYCGDRHHMPEAVDSVYCFSANRYVEASLISAPAAEAVEVVSATADQRAANDAAFASLAQDAASLINGRRQIQRIADRVNDCGADTTADYINNRMLVGDKRDVCDVLGCFDDGRAIIFAVLSYVEAERKVEFDRIFTAGRGTVRYERGDYVAIAHCHTIEYIATTLIRDSRWYLSVNFRGDPIDRTEFAASLTYAGLIEYIDGVIRTHSRQA